MCISDLEIYIIGNELILSVSQRTRESCSYRGKHLRQTLDFVFRDAILIYCALSKVSVNKSCNAAAPGILNRMFVCPRIKNRIRRVFKFDSVTLTFRNICTWKLRWGENRALSVRSIEVTSRRENDDESEPRVHQEENQYARRTRGMLYIYVTKSSREFALQTVI